MIEAEKPTEDDFNFYGIELVMVMEVLGEVDFYIKYNFFFENTTFKELFVFITFIVNLKAVFYHNILFFSKTNVYHAPNCHNLAFNVLQIDVGGLLKLPLSIRTNVYIEDKCLLARYKIKTRFSAQLFRTER